MGGPYPAAESPTPSPHLLPTLTCQPRAAPSGACAEFHGGGQHELQAAAPGGLLFTNLAAMESHHKLCRAHGVWLVSRLLRRPTCLGVSARCPVGPLRTLNAGGHQFAWRPPCIGHLHWFAGTSLGVVDRLPMHQCDIYSGTECSICTWTITLVRQLYQLPFVELLLYAGPVTDLLHQSLLEGSCGLWGRGLSWGTEAQEGG